MVRADSRRPCRYRLGLVGGLVATGCVLEANPSFSPGDASTSSDPTVPFVSSGSTSGPPTDPGDTTDDALTTTSGGSTSGAVSGAEAGSTAGAASSEDGGQTTDGDTTLGVDPGGSSSGPMIDPCEDGVLNGDETDVDCGGTCGGCERCAQCSEDADCVDSCLDGQCVEEISVIVDHAFNCGDGPAVTVDLEPGMYLARATGGASSIWGADHFNEGLTWRWTTSCDLNELSDMRSMPTNHATPELAFEAVGAPEVSFFSPGETVTCFVGDNACDDNRGAVMFSFFALCE